MSSLKNVDVTVHILPRYYSIFVWTFISYINQSFNMLVS